jgi:hypothetical protein
VVGGSGADLAFVVSSQLTQMASNIVTTPDITSWWFRRVLGPDVITCSSISAEDDNEKKSDVCVITVESAILSSAIKGKENISNEDSGTVCEVIGLYFTPVNSRKNEGNIEGFTSKLVDLYDRVNYCCGSKSSDNECCNNKTDEAKSTAGQQKNEDNRNVRSSSCKHRVKTRKLEVIQVVLSSTGNVSGACTNVFEPGFDGNSVLDEEAFRKVIKGLPWFAIPLRDLHRTVSTLIVADYVLTLLFQ